MNAFHTRVWPLLSLALLAVAVSSEAAPQKPLTGQHVPAAIRKLTPLRHANPTDRIRLAISLPMRNQPAWNAWLQDLYNPASPNYRKFLTPHQVTSRFGPTTTDYQSIISFAKAQGLTVVGTNANRLIVDVEGTVATVETAFHTSIQVYQHPSEDRTFYAPTVEPSVDLTTPILHITGLDNYVIPRPLLRKAATSSMRNTPRFGSGPFGSYLGNDFRAAYVPNAIPRGEGQSVALVEFDGYFAGDIATYEAQAGATNVPLLNILIDGFNGIPYSAGETEVTLDIDMVVAMAPGLASVLVYESTNGSPQATLDQLNQIASDDRARQISCSWGLDDNPAYDIIYQTYAAQGQSFFQAAGDSGAFVPFTISLDSDDPNVTLVGGTTLFTSGPNGSYVSETVWNWNSTGEGTDAGGGGISPNFPLPIWQQGVSNAANFASGQFRNCPDVALTADNIYIIADNGQPEPGTGGTSAAAPLWAAFASLVNEQGAQNNDPPLGFANPTLYALGQSPLYESLFHDITVGNNTNATGGPMDYPAVPGYDLASGLGTPTVALLNALAPVTSPVLRPIASVISGGNGDDQIDPDDCKNLTVTITNGGPVAATGVEGVLTSASYPAISIGQSTVTFPDVPPFSSVAAAAPFTISSAPDFICGSTVQLVLTLKCNQNTATTPIVLMPSGAPCNPGSGTCPGADLSITLSASPNPVIVGSNFVCQLVASNGGPGIASNIAVQTLFQPGTGFVAATNVNTGAISGSTGGATWVIDSLPVGGIATAYVVALSSIPDTTSTVTASINSATEDPNLDNNTAIVSVAVELPGADLGVAITGAPSPALQDGRIVYTILVTNTGPFAAADVALTTTIPNVNYISAQASQGVVSAGGTEVNLGTIPAEGGASVVLTVSPATSGDITATATVSLPATEVDPIPGNDTASTTITVHASADLAVTASESPNPSVAGSNLVYTATFTNRGPANATDVVLQQLFPTGSRFILTSAVGTNVQTNTASLVWNIGVLSNGFGGAITTILVAPTNVGPAAPPVISTFTISGQPGDPNTNDNVVVLTTVNSNAFLKVVAAGATILNGDAVSPGAAVSVALALQNAGNIPTADLTATLLSTNGVTSPSPSGSIIYGAGGVLGPGATATNSFLFTAVGTNGGTLTAQLSLRDGANDLGVVSFVFTFPSVTSFASTNFISIPAQQFTPTPDLGPANPYPSTVFVSNISGLVSQVSVTLSNMSHSFPHDVSLLLVSPTGLESVLMSSAAFGSSMTNVTFTLTPDSASPVLPAEGAIVSGSYRPGDYSGSNYFPVPAPAGPYQTGLGVFSGPASAVNGPWSLYIFDDAEGDAGDIANGWALSVETIVPVNQVADLGVSVAVAQSQIVVGSSNTLIITVTNSGPNVSGATLANTLPASLGFVSAALSQGSFTINGQTVLYHLAPIQPATAVTITNIVVANAEGAPIDSFTVAPSNPTVFDSDAANNNATASMTVVAPTAHIVALAAPPPAPVLAGQNALYTLTVSNAGPQIARGATGFFNLNGLAFVSASTSRGSFAVASGAVFCAFGDVAPGEIETAQAVAAPLTNGFLTNIWSVASASVDPAPGANTNWIVVNALIPAPIIVAGPAFLMTRTPNNTIVPNVPVTLSLLLSNIGYAPTTNLVATLQAGNGITPVTVSQNYGALAAGSSAGMPFSFVASGLPGATVVATLTVADGSASYPDASYSFVLPNTVSFSNAGAIVIPDVGAGSPYPSSILVSTNGLVTDVTVDIRGFTHSFPHDVNVLLEGPAGQTTLLQAHAGGPYSVTNLTFNFDDAATNSLPETPLSSGDFIGSVYPPIDTLPGFVVPTYNTALTVFNGTNPNGAWSLYVYDDTEGNDGVIRQGWALNLSLVSPVPALGAPVQWQAALAGGNIQLTLSADPGQAYIVQISSDLVSWISLSTNVTGAGGSFVLTDTSTNAARRFYRALQAP